MIWESLVDFERKEVKDSDGALSTVLEITGNREDYDYFIEREKIYSFGIGKGVVLYKKKSDKDRNELTILVSDNSVSYDSFDGVPIDIFCFLEVSKEEGNYLDYLSKFYRLINFSTFREKLKTLNTKEEVRRLIKKEESGLER